jgi:hypothetical protein
MKRTVLGSLVTEKALHIVNGHDGFPGEALQKAEEAGIMRNVCARVSTELADRVAVLSSMLDIRQRRFIEAALIDACDQADQIIEEEGVEKYLIENFGTDKTAEPVEA